MLGDQRENWLKARRDDLDYGAIDGICAAACAYPWLSPVVIEGDDATISSPCGRPISALRMSARASRAISAPAVQCHGLSPVS